MSLKSSALFASLMICTVSAPVHAAVVTKTYNFSASNFFPTPTPPPTPVVTGSFTLQFDDAVAVTDATAGLTINSLNIPVTSQIVYTYELGPFGYLRFGGLESGSGTLMLNTNDILFQYSEQFGSVLLYSSTLTPDSNFFTTNVSVEVTSGTSVPEPTSWAMMLLGFGLIGGTLRSAKRENPSTSVTLA